MRILLVTSFPIPGDYDGTAMLPIKISRALKARGIEVVLAYLRARRPWDGPSRTDFEGMPLYQLPPHRWVGGLRNIARVHRIDLVHAQHYGGATRAYAACRLFGLPIVYEVHSLLGEEVDRDRLGRGVIFRAYQALERRVYRHAAHVITLGRPVRDVVIREKGVDPDRTSVIYPGIDLKEYDDPTPPAAIEGVNPGDQVLMYVGSIVHPNQGVPLLIEALPAIFRAHPKARCILVGGPVEAGDIYRRQLGEYGGRLIVLPGRTPEEVVGLTKRADVLIHSRLACRENYSVQSKLAVYLAAGRPIVATDFADYRTLLGETGAGRLTAPDPASIAEGVIEVLNDPALAARLAAATRPVAEEHFGMDRNVDRYLDVYRRALNVGRDSPHLRAG